MGKIKKAASPKAELSLPPFVREFVQTSASIPLYKLPAHLASFPSQWPIPRGDFFHWVPLLNRFDDILESFNRKYNLAEGPQTQNFGHHILLAGDAVEGKAEGHSPSENDLHAEGFSEEGDRELVECVLWFTRVLFDNCANRALYSSTNHLNDLLNTTSLSLVRATLRLTFCLAQRYYARAKGSSSSHAASLLAVHYGIDVDKVHKLSIPFTKASAASKGKERPSSAKRNGSKTKAASGDLVSLLKDDENLTTLREEYGGICLSYYDNVEPTRGADPRTAHRQSPVSPTPARRASNLGPNRPARQEQPQADGASSSANGEVLKPERVSTGTGPQMHEVSAERIATTPGDEVVRSSLAVLPESYHYDFLQQYRTARALMSDKSEREKLVAVRLLAVANMCYVYHDASFQQKISQQEWDEPKHLQLPYQLTELVHPPGNGNSGISRHLQALALLTLESLAKQKSKQQDVTAALNVNVNHGVLFYLLRKATAELSGVDGTPTTLNGNDWLDSLCSLLTSIAGYPPAHRSGDSMVSAGLLGILVEILNLRTPRAERYQQKVIGFLDNFIYSVREGFQSLVNARGLDAISEITAHMVEQAHLKASQGEGFPENHKTVHADYQTPFSHHQILRSLFKFINHMMSHGAGNFDRVLRNLIDSPTLLRALRTVLSNALVFGSVVWSGAVNVLSSFIHNEPTSYAVIAEAGLSKAFLHAVTGEDNPPIYDDEGSKDWWYREHEDDRLARGILPASETITTIPQAFGAICLNEAGLKLLQDTRAVEIFFQIFLSSKHVRVMSTDMDLSKTLGNALDELARHHPALKKDILEAVKGVVTQMREICCRKAAEKGIGTKLWYKSGDKTYVSGGRKALTGDGRLYGHLSLAPEEPTRDANDVEMVDADPRPVIDDSPTDSVSVDDIVEEEKTPTTTQYLNVLAGFLTGLFENQSQASAFVEYGGFERFLDLAVLPCSPHNFADYSGPKTHYQFGRVLQILTDTKPHLVIPATLKRLQYAVDEMKPLMQHDQPQGFFSVFTTGDSLSSDGPAEERHRAHGTRYVKIMVAIHSLTNSLVSALQHGSFYQHRNSPNFFTAANYADQYARLVESLGRLQQSCIWEEILLQKNMPLAWERETQIRAAGFSVEEVDEVFHLRHDDNPATNQSEDQGSDAAAQRASASGSTEQAEVPAPQVKRDSAAFKNTQTLRYLLSKISTSITPFLMGLSRILISRRNIDNHLKQYGYMVADRIAGMLVAQLQFSLADHADPKDRHAYLIVVLSSLSHLLMEKGRENHPQFFTLVLWSFKNRGGLKVIADIMNGFLDQVAKNVPTDGDGSSSDNSLQLAPALMGIRIILTFLSQIVDHKSIEGSTQTSAMASRTDPRMGIEAFNLSQFMVETRMATVQPVQKMWESDIMEKATPPIVKALITAIQHVLGGEGEATAYKRTDKIPNRAKPQPKPFAFHQEQLTVLAEAGYQDDVAKEALYRCVNNLGAAKDYCKALLSDPRMTRNPIPDGAVQPPPNPEQSSNQSGPEQPAPDNNEEQGEASNPTPTLPSSIVPDIQIPTDHAASASWDSDVPHIPAALDSLFLSGALGDRSGSPLFANASGRGSPSNAAASSGTEASKLPEVVTVNDLDDERRNIRKTLIDRSLDVLNVHDGVTFELSDLISVAVQKSSEPSTMRGEIGSTLVQSLVSLQMDDDFRPQGKKIAAYAHLLGLVVQDKDFFAATLDELKENLDVLTGFIKVFPDQGPAEESPWIAQVLLVIERILAEDAQPHHITWSFSKEDAPEEVPTVSLPESLLSLDCKSRVLQALLDVMPRIGKDEELALATTRVLLVLTRERSLAAFLGEKKNIQRLFLMAKQLPGLVDSRLQSAFMIVLRHIVEDDDTIRNVMRTEIRSLFEGPRHMRQVDSDSYIRSLNHLALRNPEIFVEMSNEMLEIPNLEWGSRPQPLTLKKVDETHEKAIDGTAEPGTSKPDKPTDAELAQPTTEGEENGPVEKPKAPEMKPPVVTNPDGIIHYLLCELSTYKDVDEPNTSAQEGTQKQGSADVDMENADASSPGTPSAEQTRTDKPRFKADQHPIYIYRCFILQCLTELLASYNRAKVEFINFNRKSDPHAATPSKPRSAVLNHLLSALLPVGTISHADDMLTRKKHVTSNCAMSVIVSLCAKTGENSWKARAGEVEEEPELVFVRKFVLEHALKAFKDALASTEALDMKYSRLLSLADLFNRMLAGKRPSATNNMGDDGFMDSQKQLAKLMYEKNFVSALTSSITDIDLNFPNTKRAVKYILRPLKLLTATAVKVSSSSDSMTTPDDAEEDEISTASSVSSVDEERQETPDLYRNSTLAMFEPGREEESDESGPSDEDDEDDMYGEEYADDMEFDEQDSDHEGDVVSDDDGAGDDVGMEVEVVTGSEDDEAMDYADHDDDMDDDDMGDYDGDDDDVELDEANDPDDGDIPDYEEAIDDENWGSEDDEDAGEGGITGPLPAEGIEITRDEEEAAHAINQLVQVIGERPESLLERLSAGEHDTDLDNAPYLDDMHDVEDEFPEEDDDEDDFDEEEIIFEPGFEDDDDPDSDWANMEFARTAVLRHHHVPHGHHHHHIRGNYWDMPPGARDPGLGPGQRGVDDGTNPLLQRSGRHISTRSPETVHEMVGIDFPRRPGAFGPEPGSMVDFLASTIPVLQQAAGRVGNLHFTIGGAAHHPPPLEGMPPHLQQIVMRNWGRSHPTPHSSRDDPGQAVSFVPVLTSNRWTEEARSMFGTRCGEKARRALNSILRLLVPPAVKAQRIRMAEEEAEREQRRKEEEARKAKEEEERAEREAKEQKEKEEREAAERENAAAREREQAEAEQAQQADDTVESTPTDAPMEGVETTEPPTAAADDSAEPGPSEPAQRITTSIRGRELDITGLGIDLEYLEALPEELREEVLMQQVAEQRSQAVASGDPPGELQREFLDALPVDIREELLQQEAQERRRREREEARRRQAESGDVTARAEEMDPVSFLATLDPGLRQTVLMDQDEDMLAQLPQEIAMEARALGSDRRLRQYDTSRMTRNRMNDRDLPREEQQHKKAKPRPVAQIVDKAGVAALLRLMFVPLQGSTWTTFCGVLQDVCENRQNRAEVVSMLLGLLQECSSDSNSVAKSFAQLSLRAKQPANQKTPQLKRTLTGQGSATNNPEMSPIMVVQQCLETLAHLTDFNSPYLANFFLTEHDTAVGAKSRSQRKGKGKERDVRANRVPLNALLSLLDRKLIVDSSSVMEKMANLLMQITNSLGQLLKAKEKKADDQEKPAGEEVGEASGSTSAQPQPTEGGDVSMGSAAEAPAQEATQETTEAPEGSSQAAESKEDKPKTEEAKGDKHRALTPPDIPMENLRLVINILTCQECSGKTFRDTITLVGNLSPLSGAKEVFGKELVRQAQELGSSISKDLTELHGQLTRAESGNDVQAMALTKFSPGSSHQAKLLRVLTALDYLFDPSRTDAGDKPSSDAERVALREKEDILTGLYVNPTFGALWSTLSDCLTAIQQRGNVFNLATILLPVVECLMVVCKNTALKDAPHIRPAEEFAMSSPPPDSQMEGLFFRFTEDHRKILNDLVRHNPKLINGSFSPLVKNSKVLEFDNKRNYFNRRIHVRNSDMRHPHPPLQLNLRRDLVFLDSFKGLHFKKADEIKYGKLSIRFIGEEGIDAGGVTREWFQVLARQMFNPDYALFIPVASDRTTFHPNRFSGINQEHLMFFKFIGRMIGKALYEGRVLDCHFSRAVYKRILGKPVSVKDMETLDLDYYKSMDWILKNDITDIITETFSVETEAFGSKQIIDLMPDGRNIPVTEENKQEYVRLVVEYRLTGSVHEQLENFLQGFHDIVPPELISIFTEQELELLISGLPDIDVDDWKNNAEYQNYTTGSPQIQWFWRAIRSFDKEERAKLLQFITGTSKVPLNGFKELEGMNGHNRFSIHRDYGNTERLPSSHTCFNQLDLPEYDSYETLRKRLVTAFTAGSEYFGFA